MRIKSLDLSKIGVFENEQIKFEKSKNSELAEINIFTGINGSGKSTILYALASAFDYFEKGHKHHVSNFFFKRFRNFKFKEKSKSTYESEAIINFDKGPLVRVYGCPNCKGVHASTKNEKIDIYSNFIIGRPNEAYEFDFAALAYSGYRHIQSEDINTIKEFKGNPLQQSLEFVKNRATFNSFSINQWILNNYSNEALLLKFGREEESKSYANSLENFKNFISEIIDKEVDFVVNLNPTRLFFKIDGKELDFDVLPDGLKSLVSWIGDLMMVMDQLKWKDNTPIFKRQFVLLLDEIEVHLHPTWQRKILPVIQRLFCNAQIFISTHSPFIVNSVDGANIHEIEVNDGQANIKKSTLSKTSDSISYTLKSVFGMEQEFGMKVQDTLNKFYNERDRILNKEETDILVLSDLRKELLETNDPEIRDIVEFETNQLVKITKLEIPKK